MPNTGTGSVLTPAATDWLAARALGQQTGRARSAENVPCSLHRTSGGNSWVTKFAHNQCNPVIFQLMAILIENQTTKTSQAGIMQCSQELHFTNIVALLVPFPFDWKQLYSPKSSFQSQCRQCPTQHKD